MCLDKVNALFELVCGVMLWLNVFEIQESRKVRGINLWTSFFFTVESIFNLVYYTSLVQPWSFIIGLVIVGANVTWIVLAYKYRKN